MIEFTEPLHNLVTIVHKSLTGLWQLLTTLLLQQNCTALQSLHCESQSYVTTDGQSASLSWCQAPISDLRPDFSSV
jgi:hypothetical protein